MAGPSVLRFGGPRGGASRTKAGRPEARQHNRFFYMLLALPGIIWLTVLFVVPFYDVLAMIQQRPGRRLELCCQF